MQALGAEPGRTGVPCLQLGHGRCAWKREPRLLSGDRQHGAQQGHALGVPTCGRFLLPHAPFLVLQMQLRGKDEACLVSLIPLISLEREVQSLTGWIQMWACCLPEASHGRMCQFPRVLIVTGTCLALRCGATTRTQTSLPVSRAARRSWTSSVGGSGLFSAGHRRVTASVEIVCEYARPFLTCLFICLAARLAEHRFVIVFIDWFLEQF